MSTTASTQSNDRRRNRKGILAIGAIAASAALIIGGGFAYFSDTLSFGGTATAGTLDISASSLAVTQNGGAGGVSGTTVQNFNPGDTMELSGLVTNNGNKSAWIRTELAASGVGSDIGKDLYVYAGEDVPTQAEALAATDPTTLDGYIGTMDSLTAASASPAEIIGGTGTAAEADGNTTAGDNLYDLNVVVYFAKTATNEDQGEAATVTATVQALQYRNNTTNPDTSGAWSDVVTESFGS